ncbi:hypothetical protein SNOG_06338 [Parastagonospora nodorum SN15]|uniref:Uncharacterized protein n=1 Tax=Phaeosphaeria nodorum (strain SN15 / ATCC MYA-4574 / FGSC 10173) TaxID=321614 RepID=Q0UPH6_PHANO|nr:hypothetical protein SNOG_06338 [Parastagonospora nodorum SN15]EAT86169.1 hypothetical protein SNOG_06338 [Parastagonospora nodorum SN15]
MAVIPTSTTIASDAFMGTAQLNEPLLRREVAVAVGATIPVVILVILCVGFLLRRARASRNASPRECDTRVYQESKLEDGFRIVESGGEILAKKSEMEGSSRTDNDVVQRCERADSLAELSNDCAPAELYSQPLDTSQDYFASPGSCTYGQLKSTAELEAPSSPIPQSSPTLSPGLLPGPNLTPVPASSPVLSPDCVRSPRSSFSRESGVASASIFTSADSVEPGVSTPLMDNISPPFSDQPVGPYELDAVGVDSPMWMVGRVPYRWEPTTGANRMFFEADQDILPFGLKRKASQEAMSSRQRLGYAALPGSWQEFDGLGSATGMSIGVDQDFCFIDPCWATESRFCASDSVLQHDDRSCWDGSSLCEKQLMPDRIAPVDSGPSCVLEQRRQLMNESQQRFFFNAVAALHAQQDELHARFGVASPTLRENFELDGSSSAAHASAQSPSSLQSSCSFFVPETPRTSATSSTFFTTQTKQLNSDFSTVSSATTATSQPQAQSSIYVLSMWQTLRSSC